MGRRGRPRAATRPAPEGRSIPIIRSKNNGRRQAVIVFVSRPIQRETRIIRKRAETLKNIPPSGGLSY